MGTSNTSSGGIWKSSGSLPLAWSRSGRTSKRLLGGFQPCCMQICNQTHQVRPPGPPNRRQRGGAKTPAPARQQPLPWEALGHATCFIKCSLTSPRVSPLVVPGDRAQTCPPALCFLMSSGSSLPTGNPWRARVNLTATRAALTHSAWHRVGAPLEVFALGAPRHEENLLHLMRVNLLELVHKMHLLEQLST